MKKIITLFIIVLFLVQSAGPGYALRPAATSKSPKGVKEELNNWLLEFNAGDTVIHAREGICIILEIDYSKNEIRIRGISGPNKTLFNTRQNQIALWSKTSPVNKGSDAYKILKARSGEHLRKEMVFLIFGLNIFTKRLRIPETKELYEKILNEPYVVEILRKKLRDWHDYASAPDLDKTLHALWRALKTYDEEYYEEEKEIYNLISYMLKQVYILTGEDLVKSGMMDFIGDQLDDTWKSRWTFKYADTLNRFSVAWSHSERHQNRIWIAVPLDICEYYQTLVLQEGLRGLMQADEYNDIALSHNFNAGNYYPVRNLMHKEDRLSKMLLAIKNNSDKVPELISMIKSEVSNLLPWEDIDVVIPVPSNNQSNNQVIPLAESLASEFNKPIDISSLALIRETQKQKAQDSFLERAENIAQSQQASGSIRGKTVLLIDDISTTGITFFEAKRALYEAGAKNVISFAFAQTHPDFINSDSTSEPAAKPMHDLSPKTLSALEESA